MVHHAPQSAVKSQIVPKKAAAHEHTCPKEMGEPIHVAVTRRVKKSHIAESRFAFYIRQNVFPRSILKPEFLDRDILSDVRPTVSNGREIAFPILSRFRCTQIRQPEEK